LLNKSARRFRTPIQLGSSSIGCRATISRRALHGAELTIEDAIHDRPAIELVADAHTRTLAAATARIELLIDDTWEMPQRPRRRRGGLMRPVTSVAKAAGKRLLKAATRRFDVRHQSAEGVIDFRHRRFMLDYGHYARLYADGKEWSGRSGRPLSTLPPDEPKAAGSLVAA
jgi:hypothetical protein